MASIVILGIFVADLAFKAPRLPVMGETILGKGFAIGPGGKGSNQSIAAARAGGDVALITRVGKDAFAEIARKTWAADGVNTSAVIETPTIPPARPSSSFRPKPATTRSSSRAAPRRSCRLMMCAGRTRCLPGPRCS